MRRAVLSPATAPIARSARAVASLELAYRKEAGVTGRYNPGSSCQLLSTMVQDLHWTAIGLRLLLTVIAGTVLGMERSKSGHPAGLRTTLLVTLAASVAMIQMNLLIDTNGKPGNSYVVMDLMRLPLGILTGVGFIGAGAIVRKDEFVLGITTAATIWFSTVVGLCIGGGQLILGCTSTLIGFIVLSGLRPFEKKIERFQLANLTVAVAAGQLTAQQLRAKLEAARFRIKSFSLIHAVSEHREEFQCEVRWPAAEGDSDPPSVVSTLGQLPGIIEFKWETAKTAPQ